MKLFSRGEKPSWIVSLIPFIFLIAILVVVIKIFGADALSGGSQVALLMASGVVVAISMIFYKIPWKEFEEGITDNVKAVGSAILILLLIGAVAGSWMVSGVVPTLIYYGMKVITPGIFLFAFAVLFQVVTLPVEFNASTRAIRTIADTGLMQGEEIKSAKKVLNAAAMTYVASAATAILQLLRIIILTGGRRRND